ncbi:MAG: aminotransferase class I/II-fold pyridoxal phosphate-dependent enzyme [Eggerthella lenta]
MVNERMYGLGAEPSAIRELFAYGMVRKAEIGAENVFDFSIGNPSVPAPDAVKQVVLELMDEDLALARLHAGSGRSARAPGRGRPYSPSLRRARPAEQCTHGSAAAGLAISISAVTEPGDEVIIIAPFFPEYKVWIGTAGCTCVEVPAHVPDFQLDIDALAQAIGRRPLSSSTRRTTRWAPYSRENLEAFAALLARKEEELGRKLYVISDEPYREITYGAEVPYVPCVWPRTIVCYSYSKSLSLPGERIGYLYVSDLMDDAREVSTAVAGAGRALGFICAPVLFQRVIARCIDEPSDVAAYAANRELLTTGLGGWDTSSWNHRARSTVGARARGRRAGVQRSREGS